MIYILYTQTSNKTLIYDMSHAMEDINASQIIQKNPLKINSIKNVQFDHSINAKKYTKVLYPKYLLKNLIPKYLLVLNYVTSIMNAVLITLFLVVLFKIILKCYILSMVVYNISFYGINNSFKVWIKDFWDLRSRLLYFQYDIITDPSLKPEISNNLYDFFIEHLHSGHFFIKVLNLDTTHSYKRFLMEELNLDDIHSYIIPNYNNYSKEEQQHIDSLLKDFKMLMIQFRLILNTFNEAGDDFYDQDPYIHHNVLEKALRIQQNTFYDEMDNRYGKNPDKECKFFRTLLRDNKSELLPKIKERMKIHNSININHHLNCVKKSLIDTMNNNLQKYHVIINYDTVGNSSLTMHIYDLSRTMPIHQFNFETFKSNYLQASNQEKNRYINRCYDILSGTANQQAFAQLIDNKFKQLKDLLRAESSYDRSVFCKIITKYLKDKLTIDQTMNNYLDHIYSTNDNQSLINIFNKQILDPIEELKKNIVGFEKRKGNIENIIQAIIKIDNIQQSQDSICIKYKKLEEIMKKNYNDNWNLPFSDNKSTRSSELSTNKILNTIFKNSKRYNIGDHENYAKACYIANTSSKHLHNNNLFNSIKNKYWFYDFRNPISSNNHLLNHNDIDIRCIALVGEVITLISNTNTLFWKITGMLLIMWNFFIRSMSKIYMRKVRSIAKNEFLVYLSNTLRNINLHFLKSHKNTLEDPAKFLYEIMSTSELVLADVIDKMSNTQIAIYILPLMMYILPFLLTSHTPINFFQYILFTIERNTIKRQYSWKATYMGISLYLIYLSMIYLRNRLSRDIDNYQIFLENLKDKKILSFRDKENQKVTVRNIVIKKIQMIFARIFMFVSFILIILLYGTFNIILNEQGINIMFTNQNTSIERFLFKPLVYQLNDNNEINEVNIFTHSNENFILSIFLLYMIRQYNKTVKSYYLKPNTTNMLDKRQTAQYYKYLKQMETFEYDIMDENDIESSIRPIRKTDNIEYISWVNGSIVFFGNGNHFEIIRNSNWNLIRGENNIIMGKTGAGKTTIINHITRCDGLDLMPEECLYTAIYNSKKRIYENIDIHNIDTSSLRKSVTLIPQFLQIVGDMTIRDFCHLVFDKNTPDEVLCIFLDILHLSKEVDHDLTRQFFSLSGGQQKRLFITIMIIARNYLNPLSIMVTDEVYVGLQRSLRMIILRSLSSSKTLNTLIEKKLRDKGLSQYIEFQINSSIPDSVTNIDLNNYDDLWNLQKQTQYLHKDTSFNQITHLPEESKKYSNVLNYQVIKDNKMREELIFLKNNNNSEYQQKIN